MFTVCIWGSMEELFLDIFFSVQSASASAPRKEQQRALRKREKEGIVAHLGSIGEDERAESIEKWISGCTCRCMKTG